jgi:large-conductance mechanosensitive channel
VETLWISPLAVIIGAAFRKIVGSLVDVIIAFVIFLLVKMVNRMRKVETSTKDCPQCLTATRCSGCCADLQAA